MEEQLGQSEWMSASELQEWLGLGRSKTYALLREEIPSHRMGGKLLRVRLRDVEEWLENNRHRPQRRDERKGL